MIPRLQHTCWLYRASIYLVILLGISAQVWGASNIWEVQYGNTDLTNSAAAIPASGTPLLNVSSVGPVLGILVSPQANGFQLRTPDGKQWTWESGSNSLTSDGQIMPLRMPGLQQGMALYFDADTIAELAHLDLSVDAEKKILFFSSKDLTDISPQPEIGDGWNSFTIAKPKTEASKTSFSNANIVHQKINAPPTKDRFDVGVGLGYVQHEDFGLELTANGKVWGGDTSFWGLITNGNVGTKLESSHINWIDREQGIGFEGGDLYSQTWGLVRGVRYTWNSGGNHWPSLGYYLKNHSTDNPHPLLSYRDDFRIGKDLRIQGEIGTDKSRYATANYKTGNLEMYAYQRDLPDNFSETEGLVASYNFSRYLSVYYGTNSSNDAKGNKSTSKTIGVRLPIFKRYSLVLDQTEYDSDRSSATVRSAGITIPIANSVNMYVRYQENSSDVDVFAGASCVLATDFGQRSCDGVDYASK